jgi:hypothetical protein
VRFELRTGFALPPVPLSCSTVQTPTSQWPVPTGPVGSPTAAAVPAPAAASRDSQPTRRDHWTKETLQAHRSGQESAADMACFPLSSAGRRSRCQHCCCALSPVLIMMRRTRTGDWQLSGSRFQACGRLEHFGG